MANRTKTEGSGRKKGTPNKLTHEIRESIRQALGGELDKLPETLDALPPVQRVDVVLKLLKYVLPPIEAVSSNEIDEAALSPEARESGINNAIRMSKILNGC